MALARPVGAADVGIQNSAASAVAAVGVRHEYRGGHAALHSVDLTVRQREFCTLLGPSGSGKTTLLRIFAGLIQPTEGHVVIGGQDVTNLPVQQRDIGFVFQNYALFPHLTVAENIAFPLRVRGVDKAERERRVAETVELVSLDGLANRYPGQLSGGQQQRVAVARAVVFGPRVLLLDEPLGALDRRLRQQLGSELRRIQQETDTTAIYVTHDQEEAFLLSDTVVVMNDGEICQQGSPLEVYSEPADLFSATFLGDTNVLAGHAVAGTGAGAAIDVRGVVVSCRGGAGAALGEPLQCSVRPEDIQVFPPGQAGGDDLCIFGEAIVEQCIFLGSRFRLSLKVRDHRLLAEIPRGSRAPEAGESLAVGWAATAPVVIAESRKAAAGV